MPRPILLLLILVFAANVVAAQLAVCGHADALAHAAALKSADALTAAAAKGEEAAASNAGKQRIIAEAAAASLIGALFPTGGELANHFRQPNSRRLVTNDAELPTRALPPPLRPPLG